MTLQHLIEVNRYSFSKNTTLHEIRENNYAENYWPLVYVLSNGKNKRAYIGETTNAISRMSAHLNNEEKGNLTTVHLISSDHFNKSATLDIESNLIRYMSADGKFSLLNGNLGLVNHNYYQKDELYEKLFRRVWNKLQNEGIVEHSLESIDNSDLFKYSPYKSLSRTQIEGLITIMRSLLDDNKRNIVIEGGAGTGKSILAIFLFKLLHSDINSFNFRDLDDNEIEIKKLLDELRLRYNNPSMALVIPMTSFRKTMEKAFRNIPGLNPKMVIGPSGLAKQKYDIVLVDESHRLRKRKALTNYRSFDDACNLLGFDKHHCSELDWVIKQSSKSILFYDENQSVKPSDTNSEDFSELMKSEKTSKKTLNTQLRVLGGAKYTSFIKKLLYEPNHLNEKYKSEKYDFLFFESIELMIKAIQEKNKSFGLSRLIAGFSWPWISRKNKDSYDIEIEGIQLRWNTTNEDWVNSRNADSEVGCIHTTQGYDLNFTGVIFGNEISYNKIDSEIFIKKENYHDPKGKQSIENPAELKKYILNIYKTIMLRGIKGTYVYACDKDLRDYLAQHIPMHHSSAAKQHDNVVDLKPFVNSVPLYELQVAAGEFSAAQQAEQEDWVAVPEDVNVNDSLFACRVVGESMNKIIPNGSTCLFRKERGGSRNGKIVLVEHSDVIDSDSGSHYTVKEYQSFKVEDADGWSHRKIILKPSSYDESFNVLELTEDQSSNYKVIGEFVRVLPNN